MTNADNRERPTRSYKGFLVVSLGFAAVAGTSLGFCMLLGWLGWIATSHYPTLLSAHGQLQVYGFVSLYTMGVAMMILPTFLKTSLQPAWLVHSTLLTMMMGVSANLQGPTRLGVLLQMLSTVAFLGVIRATRKSAPQSAKPKAPLSREHALYLATGSLWLLASPALSLLDSTAALETVLWGFAGLYIAGIGLRVHPGMLGIKGLRGKLLLPAAGFWNLGLLLRWTGPANLWAWVLLVGVLLFLLALRPFRRSFIPAAGGAWLRYYVRTSYLWLGVSAVLTLLSQTSSPELAGAARHAFASGFVLTMMMGMGLRMIPAFELRRLFWAPGPWVVYVLLTLSSVLRVGAQALGETLPMALGGGGQLIAVMGFVTLLLGTLTWGRNLHYLAPPATQLFPDLEQSVLNGVSQGGRNEIAGTRASPGQRTCVKKWAAVYQDNYSEIHEVSPDRWEIVFAHAKKGESPSSRARVTRSCRNGSF
jgi:hypothetical protein